MRTFVKWKMHVFWCVRKLEHLVKIHTYIGRTGKPHRERPQWGLNPSEATLDATDPTVCRTQKSKHWAAKLPDEKASERACILKFHAAASSANTNRLFLIIKVSQFKTFLARPLGAINVSVCSYKHCVLSPLPDFFTPYLIITTQNFFTLTPKLTLNVSSRWQLLLTICYRVLRARFDLLSPPPPRL